MNAAVPPPLVMLDPALYRRTPWKNGGGVTVDIAGEHRPGADPAGWEGVIWRLGRTRIERPGPFSDLSGYDRILAVIEGGGLVLRAAGRAVIHARAPFRPVRFPGEWPIESELPAGPVGVLNLIADRARCAIELMFPREGARIAVAAEHCVAFAPAGARLEIGGHDVELARDAAVSFASAEPVAITLLRGQAAIASIRDRQ